MAEKYIVEGYEFDSLEEANAAKKELDAVKYMAQRTENCSLEEAYLIYKKIVDGDLFKTAVGYDYLRALEEFLLQNGVFDVQDGTQEEMEDFSRDEEKMQQAALYGQQTAVEDSQDTAKQSLQEEKKAKKEKKEKKEKKRKLSEIIAEPEKPLPKEAIELDKKLKQTKEWLKMSLFFNVLLAIGIAVMIYIASTSSNVNILNYETALQDKYSSWSEELKQKEAELKEREKAVEALEKNH